MQQIEPDKAMPSKIVLDIEEPLQKLQAVLNQFVDLGVHLQTAVADVLDCIKDRQDAEYAISLSGYEMLPSSAGEVCTGEAQEVAGIISELPVSEQEQFTYVDARDEFAKQLLRLMDNYKLYRNGKLFYQLESILGNALVLGKIGVPVLTNDQQILRHANNITRQAGDAAKRRRSHDAALRASPPKPFVSLLEQYGVGPLADPRYLSRRAD